MSIETYKLSKPIEYEGEIINELIMDLDGLTVEMLGRAEKQASLILGKKESLGVVPETNKKYLACVAAKAAGVKVDLIRSLSGTDYT